MKRTLILFTLVFISYTLLGSPYKRHLQTGEICVEILPTQALKYPYEELDKAVYIAELSDEERKKMATFPGGDDAMYYFASDNITYPLVAIESGIQGRVTARIRVNNKTGKVVGTDIVRGIDPHCDREALSVCKNLPNFAPAIVNGNIEEVHYYISILYRLKG